MESLPVLGLIHPYDPAVVYFWVGVRLIAVNVLEKKLLECADPFMVPDYGMPEGEFPSSRSILAWELPGALYSC
ncbi:hypothetical protein ACP4OV_005543 [Aristida adscensionis]